MKVFVSNRLETLTDVLKEHLFQSGGHPFARKWIIVPSQQIRQALLLRWARDEELKIATGIKIITWNQAVRQIFPDIPTHDELSLKIEKAIEILSEKTLETYLKSGGISRKTSFCNHMSRLFLQYMEEPKGWQQELWKAVFPKAPWDTQVLLQGDVYLFHCSELAPFHLETFKKMETTSFLFSPCALYWGDLQTYREQRYLLNKAQEGEREDLLNYFKNDHPLLGNWGKKGRDLLELFEEEEAFEAFEQSSRETLLTTLQEELLQLSILDKSADDSIQIHSAPSKMREVEVVWEIIQRLPYQPSEILVLTPNIQEIAAAIELIFQQKAGSFDYAIFGLEVQTKSLLIQGFKQLLALLQFRFSREAIEKLLSCPPFLRRFKLTLEDVRDLQKWFSQFSIRYDLDGGVTSWHAGLKRLVESLVLRTDELEFTDSDLLSRWIEVIQLMEKELPILAQEMTILEWSKSLKHLAVCFFSIEKEDDHLIRELDKLKNMRVEGVFAFQSIERILMGIFEQKTGSVNGSHLQAVKFAPLEMGALMPAKAVILMGIEEGKFPRQDLPSSLNQIKRSSILEDDRYLFLEAVCHARQKLILTYTRLHPEDGKSQKPSQLVEELMHHCHLKITHHPFSSFDFAIAQQRNMQLDEKPISVISVQMLKKLARHPLQYFFEERLGIEFDWEERETEFNFSSLEMTKLRKESLTRPLNELMDELANAGKMPVGSFGAIARSKIEKEVHSYQRALEKLDNPQVFNLELKANCDIPVQIDEQNWIYPALQVGSAIIEGKIDNFSKKGLLVHGDDTMACRRKIWPLYLIVKQFYPELPLLFTKKGKAVSIDIAPDAFTRYLQYAKKALSYPSPLFPQSFKDDTIVQWANRRHLLPPKWEESWEEYFKEQLHELI
jgi:exonuclease V gamma subunit